PVGTVQLVEGGVKGGGLARARGPGYQEDAVGALDDILEALVVVLAEAQVLDGYLDIGPIQDTHDHRLAVAGRQDAHAHVVVLVVEAELDAAVLGAALLGDVDAPHDLDTRDHRGQEAARRTVALDQHAVDPVAHADPVGEGLDVDVTGPQADRFLNDEVDQ